MWKTKLCMNLILGNASVEERLALYRQVGFEGFFLTWREGIDLKEIRRCTACGSIQHNDSKFCANCGEKLEVRVAEEPAALQ